MSCLVLYFFWILSYITYIRKHFCILPSPCQLCQEGTTAGAFTLLLALVSRAFRSLSPKLADGQDHTKFTDNTRGILRSRIVELKASNSTFRSTEWNIDFSRLVKVNLETISTFPSSIYAHPRAQARIGGKEIPEYMLSLIFETVSRWTKSGCEKSFLPTRS